jgi:hypothetical protein
MLATLNLIELMLSDCLALFSNTLNFRQMFNSTLFEFLSRTRIILSFKKLTEKFIEFKVLDLVTFGGVFVYQLMPFSTIDLHCLKSIDAQ